MTFSITMVCAETNEIGYVVLASSVYVGAREGAVLSGQCVVYSQARTDPKLHQIGIKAFEKTSDVDRALKGRLPWRRHSLLDRAADTRFDFKTAQRGTTMPQQGIT